MCLYNIETNTYLELITINEFPRNIQIANGAV